MNPSELPEASEPPKPASRPPLMSLDDALAALLAHAEPLPATDSVATMDADGRVLAQDVLSPLTVPPADNSSMDGYAVRSADLRAGGVALPVSQRIAAGATGTPLVAGSAARIFTGAQIPFGADAVVMQEDTTAGAEGQVRINVTAPPGQWIRRAGEDVTLGARVLARGDRLTPAGLGLAACVGLAELFVAVRPKVAMFSTGDELVMPGDVAPTAMKPGAIYNSNRFFLRALLNRLNCDVTDVGIVPDRRDATIAAMEQAARGHDLILTSGGVSVGEEDHVKPAVEALGRLDLWQIAMKPGKPFAYGTVGRNCHFIGLPGNPVSSFLTFVLLVRPFLLRLQGASQLGLPAVQLPVHFDWPRADRRREFLRVRRNAAGGLDLFANQSSGVLSSLVWGDGVIDVAAGRTLKHGERVPFIGFADALQ